MDNTHEPFVDNIENKKKENYDPNGKETEDVEANNEAIKQKAPKKDDEKCIEKVDSSLNINEEKSENTESQIVDEDPKGEDLRLGGKMPLITLLTLSIGPILSQIISSLFGVFNSIWVTKSIGKQGLEVFGAVFIVDYFQIGFAQYLMISVNIRISYLYGKKLSEKCGQLYVDFLRLAFIFGALTAALILPITKPITKWLGAPTKLSEMCLQYMLPEACLSCCNYLYMIGCGVLQAEGHSFYFALAQLTTFVLNVGVLDPLFFLVIKTPIWGCTLATAVSQLTVGSFLAFIILKGKFTLKPSKKMFYSKFSPETGQALIVGIPELVMELSLSIPLVLMQKFIEKSSYKIGIYAEATESWALTQRLYTFVEALELGFVFGYLPAASYAYGAKRKHRVLKLTIHLLWLATSISSVTAYLIVIFIRPVSSIWSNEEKFLKVASKFVPIIFYAMPLVGLSYMAPALLEALQKALSATILSIVSLLVTPITISTILHCTKKDDPYRIMLTYPISDSITSLFYIAFTFRPLMDLWKAPMDKWEMKMDAKKKADKESKEKEKKTDFLNKLKMKKDSIMNSIKDKMKKNNAKKSNNDDNDESNGNIEPSPLIPKGAEQI
ncbi:hypothetical protein M9Y10_014380 [Tritrichomonas musculus]|uniref:MatE family protein n=1 Tax=Tritrichomonas musculus TaxID=1915356 RepID=A0ABR2L2L4_9EUKA